MHRDRPLRDLHLVVAGNTLALGVGPLLLGLADEIDGLFADLGGIAQTLWIELVTKVAPADGHGVRVVDRHHPAQHRRTLQELGAIGGFPDCAGLIAVGQDGLGASRPPMTVPQSRLHVDHADRCLAIVDHLLGAGRFTELLSGHARMQIHDVHRILRVLEHLQPVARNRERERNRARIGDVLRVVARQLGQMIGVAEVREHDAIGFAHRISAVRKTRANAIGRFGRRGEDAAVDVVVPAVITAGDAALLDDAVLETRAPMRAMPVQQAQACRPVAKQHQVFTEDAHRQREIEHFARDRDRLPGAAQPFAARRAGADAGEFRVGFRHLAAKVAGVSLRRGRGVVHGFAQAVTSTSTRMSGSKKFATPMNDSAGRHAVTTSACARAASSQWRVSSM